MEREEGDLAIFGTNGFQAQVYEVVEGAGPTAQIRICGGDDRGATNKEVARVVSGRAGRIWKRLLPQFNGGYRGIELDASKEVGSRPVDPGFGDDATSFERLRLVA
jgi:hypothetical protein